ncbi:putative retrotransposon hot spot (RHS) protein [Trypanosoma rangeli]|uniref:Putative retrotransposon hot spot (RHS) protein n=1 Tax=Trypanosoma rangeli TaxID=5698 RepID=A0A3R7NA95_TRYRA|nr:putative retrotransposon hot spot (RHS) protein [Trypanosoma rangeli]RNE99458.1 putative retrotransposon hot spot (RHS) protein [Trypanosoma rangeli]|eukprot:RNE99458.1 putative retrotransposon hot spot (RHS) protein [Trypanosoma rangeli]
MVDALAKQTQSPKRRRRSFKRSKQAEFSEDAGAWRSYMGVVLSLATCIDTLANASAVPFVTLYSASIPLSLWSLTLDQALLFFPQLWSSLVADRFARRINGVTAYATTLLVTAISIFVRANALRDHSLFLYLFARLINGLFRHTVLFNALAVHELSGASKGYDAKKVVIFSLIVAMLFGGALGDYVADVAFATNILASMECAAALTLILLSFKCKCRSKTVAAVPTVNAYKNWLMKQSSHWIPAFAPSTLSASYGSMIQCMYPFIDRQIFHLDYVFIGLHLAVVIIVQAVLAPFVVKRYGKMNQWMIHVCAAFLSVGAWTSPWVTDNGLAMYFCTTLLFTDFSAAVLELMFSSVAEDGFKASEKAFASTLHRHVKQSVKQWSRIFLVSIHTMLSNREDATRVATMPIAVGLVAFIFTRHTRVALVVVPLTAWTLVASPPLNSKAI